jgi:putative nucleotidyltransferase with HDIG domain
METRIFLKKLERIDTLPTLPTIALEINKMLQDYDTSIQKLSEIIEMDQALASRLLKIANSPFYGLRRKVNNIQNAVILLGFKAVQNLVVSVSIIDAFASHKNLEGFDINDFWHHSVAVAMLSKDIGERIKYHPADDCFLAGLLHDIGKVVLSQYFQDLFKKIWKLANENNISFFHAEKSESPIDHAAIGGHLAEKWQLPEGLVDTIKHHHTMDEQASNRKLLTIVYTADTVINHHAGDPMEKLDLSVFHPDAVELVGPQLENLEEWFPRVSTDIESACSFFVDSETTRENQDPRMAGSM